MTETDTPRRWPGVLLTFLLAFAAKGIHGLPFPPFTLADGSHPVDGILLAIVLGMLLRHFFVPPEWLAPGIKYAAKKILPMAIVLLGAKLDFYDVLRVSGQALVINVTCVLVALALTLWLCARFAVRRNLALLIAIGTAICGGTAIVVTAPVIEADERDTAFAVATVTLFGLLAIVVFPLLGTALAMDPMQFGVWAGTGIHATPQVMAAGFAYGQQAGEIAVIVKLVRVLLLAPMVVVLGIWVAREKRKRSEVLIRQKTPITKLVPPFVIGFLLVALARSLNLLPDFTLHLEQSVLWGAGDLRVDLARAATKTSGFLVTMAMAGVGLGVSLRGLVQVGVKALYAGFVATLVLAAFALALVLAFL